MSTPAQMLPIPREVDLTTHEGMASELLALLTQSNLQVPISKNKEMGELLDWLEAIKEGQLFVTEVAKQ